MKAKLIEQLWKFAPTMIENTPHAHALGIKFISVDIGRASMSLPYNPDLIGFPNRRIIHGGAVTALLDQVSSLAAIAGFDEFNMVATLNLSIDYMRPAQPNQPIIALAHCYKATKHIAFIRGFAHDGDENDPIASSQATFMVTGAVPDKISNTDDAQSGVHDA